MDGGGGGGEEVGVVSVVFSSRLDVEVLKLDERGLGCSH